MHTLRGGPRSRGGRGGPRTHPFVQLGERDHLLALLAPLVLVVVIIVVLVVPHLELAVLLVVEVVCGAALALGRGGGRSTSGRTTGRRRLATWPADERQAGT